MDSDYFIVSGWSNGSSNNITGGGYGIRISKNHRDQYFNKSWKTINIEFDDRPSATVNISKSFWHKCPELRSSEIGKWMLDKGLAPWPKGKPPKLKLIIIGQRRFKLSK